MTNQAPAEALRQQLVDIFGLYDHELTDFDYVQIGRILKTVTAYAATVEREARIEELSHVQLEHGNYVTQTWIDEKAMTILDRLAALQGPLEQ